MDIEVNMVVMNYITPDITKIDFKDRQFVITKIGRDNIDSVQALIESRGGIVKGQQNDLMLLVQ